MPKKTGILEAQLEQTAKQGAIESLQINETAEGFYVVATVNLKTSDMFLATRREPDQPRIFKDLERLNNLLRNLYPTGTIELKCEQKYITKTPANIKPTKKRSNKKRSKKKR